jgi:glycerol-3-phosphate dehydrogenase (NAD(P)+)
MAIHLTRVGHTVCLAPRRAEHAEAIRKLRVNADYLPGIALPDGLQVDVDLSAQLAQAELILLACPAQALRETCRRVHAAWSGERRKTWIVSLAKGLETGSHLRPTQVVAEEFPNSRVCALTGPTNAAEVARGLPAAMVLASSVDPTELTKLQASLSGPTLRVYTSDDVAGVEYGGCLKNVYAIAAGCCDGLRMGDNAKAALLTRALTELIRVGASLGARTETFYGLSGFGDLVATCHGAWSRNREFGHRLGEGATTADLIANRKTVVEGYRTTESLYDLCQERGIEAPILTEVYRICFEGKKVSDAMMSLMTRMLKRE